MQIQTSDISQKKANPQAVTDYLVIPVEAAIFAFNSRKFNALRLLFELKIIFRSGQNIISKEVLQQIAEQAGIKSWATIQKHLNWLQRHGFLTYFQDSGKIRLYSLFKRFSRYKTGIRYFSGSNLKQTLFAGVGLWLIKRNDFTLRKSGKKGGRRKTEQDLPGISLAYLAEITQYSLQRISQLKQSPHLDCRHRYAKTKFTETERKLIREYNPAEGRKLRTFRGHVTRQLVDSWRITGIEITRRRRVA
jgi:hypothetical protein